MADAFQSVRRDGIAAISALNTLDDVNIRDKDGENLLHVAIAYSNNDVVEELIQRGVDVNAQDSNGLTPLHYACSYGNSFAAEQILDNGGDIKVSDVHGNTALWTAVFNAKGKLGLVKTLMARGASCVAHNKNKYGRSPIDFALQIKDTLLLNMLSAPTDQENK